VNNRLPGLLGVRRITLGNGLKTVSFGTKMSEAEAVLFRDLAAARGMDASALIRQLILREIVGKPAVEEAHKGNSEDSENIRVIRKKLGDLLQYTKLTKDFEIEHGTMTLQEHYDICVEACKRG
jgi:hypothetical protein